MLKFQMAELLKVVCIGTVMLMLSGGAAGYYRGLEEEVEQIDAVPPDIESSPYLLPKLSHHFAPFDPQPPNGLWKHVSDPNLYILSERESQDKEGELKSKRNGRNGLTGNGPSLSIVNPLEVLRQRLLLEIARRRMRQSEDQIQANRELLKTIGKRSLAPERRRDPGPAPKEHRANQRPDTENHSAHSDRWNRHTYNYAE
ncbi:unnamed protein product [Bemisia tabaci]|uniref:Corticotropin-releasing factor domain-containing protein n=2 Tax=Bemisia tabaci TaxID=7038 RepID=A0A9P0A9X1_BEMTA|nr:unnamed protein product [Bemisia tabaci]